jgi:hypothetical protein
MAKNATAARTYLQEITEALKNSSLSEVPTTALFPNGPYNHALSELLNDNNPTDKHLYLIGPGQLKPINRRRLAGRYLLSQSLVIIVSSLVKGETYESVRKKPYWTKDKHPDNRVLVLKPSAPEVGIKIIETIYKMPTHVRATWRGLEESRIAEIENSSNPSEAVQDLIKDVLYV